MKMTTEPITFELSEEELEQVESLIEHLLRQHTSVENETFATDCSMAAHHLPMRLRRQLYDFRNQRNTRGYLLVKGFSVDDESIGPTPENWDAAWNNPPSLREEIFQCLISSSSGEIFGWLTQENGRFLRHIVPIKKDENEQLGGSSKVTLLWHIEEAFHPHRADMMSIMCYRNNECASTNLCPLQDLNIPDFHRKILSESRFIIYPDKSHTMENNTSALWSLDEDHFNKIRSFIEHPQLVSVLSGKPGKEHLLIDEAFMEAVEGDQEAQNSLDWLHREMDKSKTEIVSEPGDLLLIDNRITVHGRSPYKPHYGPKARWMRRVNLTTDLVKSHEWKNHPYARVIL